MINKHLYRDHGGISVMGSLEEKFAAHRKLHEETECDHDHLNPDDLAEQYGHYYGGQQLRVRVDRVPKQFTLTYHLASEHQERIVGGELAKMIFHGELHETAGGWAGNPEHRHPDDDDLSIVEYKEDHVNDATV